MKLLPFSKLNSIHDFRGIAVQPGVHFQWMLRLLFGKNLVSIHDGLVSN